MKKIININLSSRLIPIEDTAYELLKNYLDSLNRHFGTEEGGEEIVGDIENRIAEVFQDKLKKGAHCITDEDVNAMIRVMGRPEQLEEETVTRPLEKESASASQGQTPPQSKRLMRDDNDKIIGGVCSGIASYFGVDPVIVRILTFLLILAWGTGLIVYLVLWLVLPSSRSLKNPVRKRLYRNPDNRVVGGVCSGIAAYANIDPVVPRILFVLPLLAIIFTSIFKNWHWFWFPGFFFPLSVGALPTLCLLYIVLWISVPKAKTVTEKLEMRGEKVDLQNIANAMRGSQEEKKTEGGQPGPVTAAEATSVPAPSYRPDNRSGLRDALVLLLKIFGYFILAVIVITIGVIVLAAAGASIGLSTVTSLMLPYPGLILSGPLQHILAWPAILLTIGVPVVALIWLLIKLVTGFRPKTRYVGPTLFVLWVIGLICAAWLCVSVGRDFRMNYQESSTVRLVQPDSGRLVLSRPPSNYSFGGWSPLSAVMEVGEDTLILKTIRLDIGQSRDDSFHVEVIRSSNGHSLDQARRYAESIRIGITQQDSMLYIPDGFTISRGSAFRNQHVRIKVSVPAGRHIRVDDNLKTLRRFRNWSGRWDWHEDQWDGGFRGDHWDYGRDYQMTPDGLKSSEELHGEDRGNLSDSAKVSGSVHHTAAFRSSGSTSARRRAEHRTATILPDAEISPPFL
jgi:phage shock protein PspC (stress-responsive transcriptional regulator)